MEILSRKKRNKLLEEAIKHLQQGELIVYPTDTLYALGADIFNEEAVRKVYMVKRRPLSEPLPVAVSCVEEISRVAKLDPDAEKLVKRFLPGPLTIILPRKPSVPGIVTSGGESIAIRIPDNISALTLLSQFGPLTVTSANLHGVKPPGFIKDIKLQLRDKVALYIDEGELSGPPSTIVDLTTKPPRVVREGVIPEKKVLSVVVDG